MDVRDLIENAREVLRRGPPLRLAVLFGSRTTGRVHPGSDLDLAIIPREHISLWEEGDLAAELEAALGCPVDLVRLDLAPTLVRWEVIKNGIVVLADPPEEWPRLLAIVMAEHADLAPATERIARSFLRRLAGAPVP